MGPVQAALSGPRFLDEDQLRKIKPETLRRYKLAAQPLASWLVRRHHNPLCAAAWDDLIIEWKRETRPTKTQLELTVAAVEFSIHAFGANYAFARTS